MKPYTAFILVLLLAFMSSTAWAFGIKNPAHSFKGGENALGFGAASTTMSFDSGAFNAPRDADISQVYFEFTLGVGEAGALGFQGGILETQLGSDPSSDGVVAGIVYRHNLNPDGDGLRLGFSGALRTGFVENDTSETDITQIQAGFGGGLELSDQATLYGGLVFNSTEATIDIFAVQAIDIENEDNLGGFVGFEFQFSDKGRLGVEAHLLYESGVAFYMEFLL